MTALNTSFFFSGSNFCAAFLHIRLICGSNLSLLSVITPNVFSLQLFVYSVECKVIVFTTNSETHLIAFLRI